MEISIKVDGEEKEEKLIFTNYNLDNYNFVNLVAPNNEEYIISVDDLEAIWKTFKVYQDRYMNDN